MVRVFANNPENQGSIDALLNTQYIKVQIKGKWCNLEKGVAPDLILWCSR